jgi:hypothetical protein
MSTFLFFYILEVDIAMYVLKITCWINLNTLKQTHSTQTQSAPGQVIRTYDKWESLWYQGLTVNDI